MVKDGDAAIQPLLLGSDEYDIYITLTNAPARNRRIIDKGEAAVIALAAKTNGIVASNNLKDISIYITDFHLQHITTGGILIKAHEQAIITESEGNRIWNEMLAKRRKLGAITFTDYMRAQH
ncbi:MAG: hypothetical protein LBL49_09960 [Clostridiales Family XIII bacterium]|jgi:predicted nucleic acid-binding protein|nr:hypothetical protein [Clostridiales Family XIII bacterium]